MDLRSGLPHAGMIPPHWGLLLGLLTVIGILISDLLLVVVDPRIRLYGR